MPIVHIVLVKVRPGIDSSNYVETSTKFLRSAPGVLTFKVGHATNGPAKNKGFNFALVMEFRDEAVRSRILCGLPGPSNE